MSASLISGSPAKTARIATPDLLLKADDTAASNQRQMRAALTLHGSTFSRLTLTRDGKRVMSNCMSGELQIQLRVRQLELCHGMNVRFGAKADILPLPRQERAKISIVRFSYSTLLRTMAATRQIHGLDNCILRDFVNRNRSQPRIDLSSSPDPCLKIDATAILHHRLKIPIQKLAWAGYGCDSNQRDDRHRNCPRERGVPFNDSNCSDRELCWLRPHT